MCLGGSKGSCYSIPDRRSETDIPPRHFRERHIPDWRAGLGFKDVSQIEQILVGKVRDRGFDLGKAPHRVIAAIGDPLHSCLEHVALYHKRRGGGRGIHGRLAEVIWSNARNRQAKEASRVENRTAFWQKSQRAGAYSLNSKRRNHSACGLSALGQNWWIAARPLSGGDRR
jgi:hypothetical protein